MFIFPHLFTLITYTSNIAAWFSVTSFHLMRVGRCTESHNHTVTHARLVYGVVY